MHTKEQKLFTLLKTVSPVLCSKQYVSALYEKVTKNTQEK